MNAELFSFLGAALVFGLLMWRARRGAAPEVPKLTSEADKPASPAIEHDALVVALHRRVMRSIRRHGGEEFLVFDPQTPVFRYRDGVCVECDVIVRRPEQTEQPLNEVMS